MNFQDNIFVSIASFRDTECLNTLKDIYYKADHPDNIYCGIFTQVDKTNMSELCYDPTFQYNSNIRQMTVSYSEAKGPLWARIRIIKSLYHGEPYYLMIDAHTQLLKGWDTELKTYIKFLNNKGIDKPIITTYPADSNLYDINSPEAHNIPEVPVLCKIKSGNKYPEMIAAINKPNGYFYKTYLVSGNFMFCQGSYISDINIDKLLNLSYIFHGEEYLFAVLAYVNGYDIYSPPKNICFHKYKTVQDKSDTNTEWTQHVKIDKVVKKNSYNELKKLLTTDKLDNIRKTKDLLHIIKGNQNNLDNLEHMCNSNEKIEFYSESGVLQTPSDLRRFSSQQTISQIFGDKNFMFI